MHGLILAGGIGSRLSADGVTEPKPLVQIGGQPQLLRLCETLEALGCTTVTCMVRTGVSAASIVRDSFRRRAISCATPSSLHTLALGLEAMPAEPVFCTMVDTVMPWESWLNVWTAWQSAMAHDVTALLAVTQPPARDQQPLYVEMDDSDRITMIGASAHESSFATAGVYGFGAAVRPLAARAVEGGMHRMREFLASLSREGLRLQAVSIPRALDVDCREDLEEANIWAPAARP